MSDITNPGGEYTPTQSAAAPKPTTDKQWYRIFWRWHFFAGLYVLPFMFMLSFTGLIYLYEKPIENWLFSDRIYVEQQENKLSYDQQVALLKAKNPKINGISFDVDQDPTKSTKFQFKDKSRTKYIAYMNPYNGEILAQYKRDESLMRMIRKFHGELLLGKFGTKFVEIAASWSIILFITGLYLWWPKKGERLASKTFPKSGIKGRQWHIEWHRFIGLIAFILIMPILITGLPWTDVTGGTIKMVQKQIGQSSNSALRSSRGSKSEIVENGEAITILEAIKIAESNKIVKPYKIEVPSKKNSVYFAASTHENSLMRNSIHLDQYSGAVVKYVQASDNPIMAQAISAGISLHQGRLFGTLNLILASAAAVLGMLLALTGFYAWWLRKPKGKLAAPAKVKQYQLSKAFWIGLIVLAIFLPMMTISLIMVLLLEQIWLKFAQNS